MKICRQHEKFIIVYSSDSCPICEAGGILEAAEQRMGGATRMVDTVRRALDKNHEEYFISTLDLAGEFIDQSREEVGRIMKILLRGVPKKEPEEG